MSKRSTSDASPNPRRLPQQGTTLSRGPTGICGNSHLAAEFLNERTGTRFHHVAYKGGAPLDTAFADVQVLMVFVTRLNIATMLNAPTANAVARPEMRRLLADFSVEPRSTTPQEPDKLMRGELEQWSAVIKKADVKL